MFKSFDDTYSIFSYSITRVAELSLERKRRTFKKFYNFQNNEIFKQENLIITKPFIFKTLLHGRIYNKQAKQNRFWKLDIEQVPVSTSEFI